MEFNDNIAIYLQIANLIYDRILSGEWKPMERIPAIRELSVTLEVNPNTVMRTYQLLETLNIITVKRGTGFYLTENSYDLVFSNQKKTFLDEQLPNLFKKLQLLNITPEEFKKWYEENLMNPLKS